MSELIDREAKRGGGMTATHGNAIVGGGARVFVPAIAATETDPRLRVAVVSKVYPMRSHTVSAEGGAAGAISADDSLDEHAYDTISGGDWLCDQDAVEAFVAEAPKELLRLEHWGCPWSREPDGHVAVRAFGGMTNKRTWFAADKTGFHLLHTLFQTSLSIPTSPGTTSGTSPGCSSTTAWVCALVVIELMSGAIETITARAVVIATGGGGRVFPFTTNAAIKTGDGMALAYRAGAPLKDMEFVDDHHRGRRSTASSSPRLPAPRAAGCSTKTATATCRITTSGSQSRDRCCAAWKPRPRRDRLSQAFVHEAAKGRTIDSPYGPVVHLDLRHLGEKVIDAKLPMVRELCRDVSGSIGTEVGSGASRR